MAAVGYSPVPSPRWPFCVNARQGMASTSWTLVNVHTEKAHCMEYESKLYLRPSNVLIFTQRALQIWPRLLLISRERFIGPLNIRSPFTWNKFFHFIILLNKQMRWRPTVKASWTGWVPLHRTLCGGLNSVSIHGGRVVNALACNARGDGLASHLRRYFRDLFLESIQSPARRDLKWSVWHYRNWLWPVMSVVITGKKLPRYRDGRYNKCQTIWQSSIYTHTYTFTLHTPQMVANT